MLAYTFERPRVGPQRMTPKPKKGLVKRGAWEITKKLLKAIPIIGPVFVVGFAGYDIKKKGLVPGAVHVGLDVTPVVGTCKNVLEIFTGDLIPDKTPKVQTSEPDAHHPAPQSGDIARSNQSGTY
jgi:hypothetical protein